jgi:putative acyl-CoA dehydrogenase
MPRLLRDSPLNSIWEGSGNVTALDVLRALARSPDCAEAVLAEIDLAADDQRIAAAALSLREALKEATSNGQAGQRNARLLAGQLTVTLQAALLVRHAPAAVADAFCASRLGQGTGTAGSAGPGAPFGSFPGGLDLSGILVRSAVTSR